METTTEIKTTTAQDIRGRIVGFQLGSKKGLTHNKINHLNEAIRDVVRFVASMIIVQNNALKCNFLVYCSITIRCCNSGQHGCWIIIQCQQSAS